MNKTDHTSINPKQSSMHDFFVFIARKLACFKKWYYPKIKKRIWISVGILFLIFYVLAAVNNATINRILFIPVGSVLAITILVLWIESKYYKPFVIIDGKFFTPNTIVESFSQYVEGRMENYLKQRLLYNSCANCTRKQFCTSRSTYVRQCDLYYDSFQVGKDSSINLTLLTQHVIKGPFDNKPTFSSFIDPRDGNKYKIVIIGNQTWMAENLRYIPYVSHEDEHEGIWVNGYYGNDVKMAVLTQNYLTYGCLYSKETAPYVCPEGYHIPTIDEWMTLIYCFGGANLAGNKLKAQIEWNLKTSQLNNESGFSALPGGYRTYYCQFSSVGTVGNWWSSSVNEFGNVFFMCMQDNRSTVIKLLHSGLSSSFSIRCIKDKEDFFE